MGHTSTSSLQVYSSDILLLLTTFVSLTFRACRQGIDSSSYDEDSGHVKDTETRWTRASSASSFPLDERTPGTGDGDDADEPAVDSEALLLANDAADPLLILAERLTLEEKLSTAVNWLSLVSNCLTYFLRPSQVLYTFLFTNGDFVLFVTSYSRRYQRLHPSTPPRSHLSTDSSLAPTPLHPMCQQAPLSYETTVPVAPTSPLQGLGSESGTNTHHLHGRFTGDGARRQSCGDVVAVRVPPPSHLLFPPGALPGPRHRESAPQRVSQKAGGAAATTHSPLSLTNRSFPLGRPLHRLRYYASRCVAFAQTQLSWLLFLNALLTSTLFVFHLHHLFFSLGTLFGYLAAVAAVFLCGMEAGCIIVLLRRRGVCRCHRCRRRRRSSSSSSSTDTDDGEDGISASTTVHSRCRSPLARNGAVGGGGESTEWDPRSDVQGPHWAVFGEHLSAAACALLYILMLLEEGDVLWSSHVDLMRWYVCSCALMILSLLKCLRVAL
ncbi:hypothetical protein ABL78_7162 [Leptomonas seymouri]|uniref:Uncharacterized protein n=1 Tax=Leptomonas seymouri TaxID=5684 RepID=A0A0N1PAF9_LEPSE|nr:hypothetical protein ABL78_7162 [Leptomonas seymouri]|eukprot:KPI83798.1 hypothetical protein ABL78_7162 [Leptomonas seymouri]